MSSKTIPEILSKSIDIENAYATISYKKKAIDNNTAKFATLTKTGIRKREWLESGKEHGFLRLYAPTRSRSLIYPVTLQTTVQDICSILGFEGLYLQIGGYKISTMRLTSFICCALTELDVRDNENLFELDLSNLHTIQDIVQALEYVGNVSIIVVRFKRAREEYCYRNGNREESSTMITSTCTMNCFVDRPLKSRMY
ncbi:Uncharacterized protein ACO02O_11806 [Dirofilaria immitis]